MADISKDDIREVARLSGFSFSDEELEVYREQFEKILGYMDRLSDVDTEGLEPTYQVTGLQNATRADKPVDYGVSQEELLQNAPMRQENEIKVRRVL